MRMPMGGMMGSPQGMPGRGFGGQMGGGFGGPDVFGGGMGGGFGGRGHPGMRGPQDMVQPGGPNPWQQFPGGWAGGGPEGMAGPIGSYPNLPPQFQGGRPAGMDSFRQPGFVSGGRDDPSMGGSGYWGGDRGIPGGMGGRPEAGPPVPRRLPGRDRY